MAGSGPRALAASAGTTLLLIAWSLLGIGDSLREGEFTPVALSCVLAGFVLAVGVVVSRYPLAVPDRAALAVPVAVCLVLAIAHPASRYMHVAGSGRLLLTQVLAAAATVMAGVCGYARGRWERRAWAATGALAIGTGIATVVVASNPRIDVWYLLQQSSAGLLHGADMYRQHWAHSTGLQAVYPYLPATTVILAPFKWLLGDVRYGLLAALLAAALLIRRLDPKAPAALAALVLVLPHWAFLVDQSWTEPLLLAALAAAVLALRRDRPGLAVLGLAAALACKQHIVLLLPLFALWPGFGWRRTAQAVGLALLAVLPWIVAGPSDFWHDTVHANLSLGVLTRALCLPSLFARWGFTVGFWFLALVLIATYAVVLRFVPRTPSGLALASALVLWALDLANKQSFFNHYTLPMGLVLVALAAAGPSPAQPAVPHHAGTLPAADRSKAALT